MQSRKNNDAPPSGVNLNRLPDLVKTVESKKGDLVDAQMDHASAWKSVKDQGFDTDPLKVIVKLRKMDALKRQAWLTNFYEYARKLGMYAQSDLLQGDAIERSAEAAAGATPEAELAATHAAAREKGREIGLAGQDIDTANFPEEERTAALEGWNDGQEERVRLQMGDGAPGTENGHANGNGATSEAAPKRARRSRAPAEGAGAAVH